MSTKPHKPGEEGTSPELDFDPWQNGGLKALVTVTAQSVVERYSPNVREFLTDRQPLVWVLALIIGVSVGYSALGFRWLIGVFQLPWLYTMSENVAAAASRVPWWNVVLAPTLGGLLVGYLLERYVAGRRAHAVADVIEARALHDCRIDPKIGFWSALLSAISLGCGASAGREGPIVHLGATLAAWIDNWFNLSASARRTLLASGVAAAISASFNAPIAGVLFAHEVILGHYAFRALVPIVLSSAVGTIITRTHFGDFPAFLIPQYQITSYLEFPAFALLGLTCAIVAILFEFTLMATEHITWRFKMPLWVRTGLTGFAVGIIALVFPQVLGVGYDATNEALSGSLSLTLLLSLIVAKTVATAITLAGRFAGGVFSPSLYLGAMTGAAFGIIATSVFPDVGSSLGLYAILGMGGVAAAVLGAPISTTLIVFELTGGYQMTIALLLTVSISVGLTQAFLGHSIFHWQLGKRGLFLHEGPHKSIMRRLRVQDFMTEPSDGSGSETLSEKDDAWLLATDTMERALRLFDTTGEPRIAVVSDGDQTRIIAWAERVQALHLFNRELIATSQEEHR